MGREAGAVRPTTDGDGTRLSRWHPYPAMVPDDLARSLAERWVLPGKRVLDPFCGSGRLLMAASALGGDCVGLDVNPLACLITEAKAAAASKAVIAEIVRDCAVAARSGLPSNSITLRGTTVQWFSETIGMELAQIISWINGLDLEQAELLVVATALSAAMRDAAWIRKSGWKLHRMGEASRSNGRLSAWTSFAKRLTHYLENADQHRLAGSIDVYRHRASAGADVAVGTFDVVLTSPPYGDSRTTVQYGAASAICLDVVSRLIGLEHRYIPGSKIDGSCLGGSKPIAPEIDLKRFWAGSPVGEGAIRVSNFLMDFGVTCRKLVGLLEPGGIFAMVVGRRSVRGFRVKLDEFAITEMEALGLTAQIVERRQLQNKRLPRTINRFARAACEDQRASGRTKTMHEEIILTFRNPLHKQLARMAQAK
jgi:site-specific DNA-methyltransferase (cytosine-N4-specific)